MDLIKLFWYLIHIELMVRNDNGISTDMIDDTIENDYTTLVSALFSKIWQLLWNF